MTTDSSNYRKPVNKDSGESVQNSKYLAVPGNWKTRVHNLKTDTRARSVSPSSGTDRSGTLWSGTTDASVRAVSIEASPVPTGAKKLNKRTTSAVRNILLCSSSFESSGI